MRNHIKIKAIRNKFPNGYMIWVMILEYLTGADGNEFHFSDIQMELMAGDFGVSVTEIRETVDFCIRLELLFVENEFVCSHSLNERLLPVYQKRKSKKDISEKQKRINGTFGSFCDRNPQKLVELEEKTNNSDVSVTETIQPATETPQSKVKESIVNKSKEINNKENFEKKRENSPIVEKPIADSMFNIWVKSFPKYPFRPAKDDPALTNLAYFIGEAQGWKQHEVLNGKKESVLSEWTTMVEWIKKDSWFGSKDIPFLEKHWATLIQKINQPKNGTHQKSASSAGRGIKFD